MAERIEDIGGGELTAIADSDLLVILDASDTTDDASGTAKYCTALNLSNYASTSVLDRLCDGYVSSASASSAITATVYRNILENATIADAGLTGSDWTVDNTSKRFTYSGPDTIASVSICLSITSTKSNEIARFRIAKNGTAAPSTEICTKIDTGSDVDTLAGQALVSLTSGDYIELHGTLDTSTADTITVNNCNVVIRG